MDSFFDIMNIRNIQSHEFERKPFLVPFTSVNDDRFGWLQNVFLKYFEDWLHLLNNVLVISQEMLIVICLFLGKHLRV